MLFVVKRTTTTKQTTTMKKATKKTTTKKFVKKEKIDVNKMVTDFFIEVIQKSIDAGEKMLPWQKPWMMNKIGGLRNGATNRSYSGINIFLLAAQPFESPTWFTYKQAQDCGGNVRKGEKGTIIVYYNFFKTTKDGEEKIIPMLKYHKVFNYEQCEGLDEKYSGHEEVKGNEFPEDALTAVDNILASYEDAPTLKFGGGRACYNPSQDVVKMPPVKSFRTPEHYAATLFHEMGHSTGHDARLNRQFGSSFGNELYSREELVAEFTATILMATAGLETPETEQNTVAYLRSWLKHLSDNPTWLVWAASRASKSADWIMGKKEIV